MANGIYALTYILPANSGSNEALVASTSTSGKSLRCHGNFCSSWHVCEDEMLAAGVCVLTDCDIMPNLNTSISLQSI